MERLTKEDYIKEIKRMKRLNELAKEKKEIEIYNKFIKGELEDDSTD